DVVDRCVVGEVAGRHLAENEGVVEEVLSARRAAFALDLVIADVWPQRSVAIEESPFTRVAIVEGLRRRHAGDEVATVDVAAVQQSLERAPELRIAEQRRTEGEQSGRTMAARREGRQGGAEAVPGEEKSVRRRQVRL